MNSDYEKYIRETLQAQNEQVDAEAIWANVEPHVRPKKKRRFFWWFFFGASIVVLLSVGLWAYSQMDVRAEGEMAGLSGVNTTEHEEVNLEKTQQEINTNQRTNTIGNSTKAQNLELPKADENKSEQSSKIANINKNKENIKLENIQPLYSERETAVRTTARNGRSKQKTKETNGAAIANEEKVNSVKSSKIGSESNVLKSTGLSTKQPGITTNETEKQNASNREGNLKTNLVSANAAPKVNVESILVAKLFPISFLMQNLFTVGEWPINKELAEVPETNDGKKGSQPPVDKLTWGIGGYLGIGRPSPNLSSNNDNVADYVSSRTTTETQLESISFGLGITAQTKKNISIRTGLEYYRIARHFTYQESTIEYDTIPDGIIHVFFNQMTGDTIVEKGEVVNSLTTSHDKKTYNYLHRLDVPIMLGYSFAYGDWSIGAEAGALANVYFRRKGEILVSSEGKNFYDIKKDGEKWYKTNLGLSPLIQLNFNYNFGESMQVHASPYFRFRSVYNTAANPVKERYSGLGMQVGVKYWVGR